MSQNQTPYDTDLRLRPRAWEGEALTTPGAYGKVDFDNDEGATMFTAWLQKNEAGGCILRVDEYQDVELTIETSSQRQIREAAMQELDKTLRALVAPHAKAVTLVEEDPETFGRGHYVLENTPGDRRIVITEQYIGTDWSDDERVPNSWHVETESRGIENGTLGEWGQKDSRVITPDTLPGFIDYVASWVEKEVIDHPAVESIHAMYTRHHRHLRPESLSGPSTGPTY
ncbi:hypothetical protein EDF62_0046 [Leucobacter luti]|uniref:Uncharacterized protein n=1 Tax=Leucobacter luti TaxID=340320 RepID=A0A4R6S915_9MICO|nr:hypothetical protein [Leucobacter luti]TDP95365.1 hypothetical protein EDF62_0046 [Leucobacter luti]